MWEMRYHIIECPHTAQSSASMCKMYTLFTGVCHTLNQKKKEKKSVMKSKARGGFR